MTKRGTSMLSIAIGLGLTAILIVSLSGILWGIYEDQTRTSPGPLILESQEVATELLLAHKGDPALGFSTLRSNYTMIAYAPSERTKPLRCKTSACICIYPGRNQQQPVHCELLPELEESCTNKDSCFAEQKQLVYKASPTPSQEPQVYICKRQDNSLTFTSTETC